LPFELSAPVMQELHRIASPQGLIEIYVPQRWGVPVFIFQTPMGVNAISRCFEYPEHDVAL